MSTSEKPPGSFILTRARDAPLKQNARLARKVSTTCTVMGLTGLVAYQVLPNKNAPSTLVISKRQSSAPCVPTAFNFTREVHDKFAPGKNLEGISTADSCNHYAVGWLQADSIEIVDSRLNNYPDTISLTSDPGGPAYSRQNKAIIEVTDLLVDHSRLPSLLPIGRQELAWTKLHTANPSCER
jgi:hypothetical protein